ncbi:MAG: hypothetical protein ACKN87_24105 [Microcystis aeruginosa]
MTSLALLFLNSRKLIMLSDRREQIITILTAFLITTTDDRLLKTKTSYLTIKINAISVTFKLVQVYEQPRVSIPPKN